METNKNSKEMAIEEIMEKITPQHNTGPNLYIPCYYKSSMYMAVKLGLQSSEKRVEELEEEINRLKGLIGASYSDGWIDKQNNVFGCSDLGYEFFKEQNKII